MGLSFSKGSFVAHNSVKPPLIVVFGIGGAGCNAVNNMIKSNLVGVKFVIANTDYQSLSTSLCENKIQLGSDITHGLGAGSSAEVGYKAAQESAAQIEDAMKDANMVFVTAGMGGGTGTGAAPVVASIAKQKGILTVGVVTKPFKFERDRRMKIADLGIKEMEKSVHSLIVVSNQNVFRVSNEKTTLAEAFESVDNVLLSGVRCITDLVIKAGLVNLDFADIASVMSFGGKSVMGEGESTGESRAIKAAEKAITNPILEYSSIKGAKGILINISGGEDMTLHEVNAAIDVIVKEVDLNANMKFGSTIDPSLNGVVRVSVVATGVDIKPMGQQQEIEERLTVNEFSHSSPSFKGSRSSSIDFSLDGFGDVSENEKKSNTNPFSSRDKVIIDEDDEDCEIYEKTSFDSDSDQDFRNIDSSLASKAMSSPDQPTQIYINKKRFIEQKESEADEYGKYGIAGKIEKITSIFGGRKKKN